MKRAALKSGILLVALAGSASAQINATDPGPRPPARAEAVGSIINRTESQSGNSGLHEAGGSADHIQLDINNDGTLDSPLGELKKKGN